MPSHAKNVQAFKEAEPLFTRYEVERQLNAMFSPQVTLPSGGYIIINQTEALVAVDVNSGKSTREFSIEDTALKTNLEAADEIARQLRLRDLAGLIVVDFIDMEERRNNRAVERRLKEALRDDRARIQVGRISHFGLLEMSRQRIRTGMLEGSTTQCSHCQGTGVVRSTESVALSVLRSLEDWLRTNAPYDLNAVASAEVALYILNQKRSYLQDIEKRHGVTISITASDRMHGANFYIEKIAPAAGSSPVGLNAPAAPNADRIIVPFGADGDDNSDDQGQKSRRRRRRSRRGRGGEDDEPRSNGSLAPVRPQLARDRAEERDEVDEAPEAEVAQSQAEANSEGEAEKSRRRSRRRGRRGGRDRRASKTQEAGTQGEYVIPGMGEQPVLHGDAPFVQTGIIEPKRAALATESAPALEVAASASVAPDAVEKPEKEASPVTSEEEKTARSFRGADGRSRGRSQANGTDKSHDDQSGQRGDGGGETAVVEVHAETALAEAEPEPMPAAPPKPRGSKRGWWQRKDA